MNLVVHPYPCVMTASRWATWHEAYADPESGLSRRLRHVQRRLADGLTAAPPGPITVISLCAGEGRDVVGVVSEHPRRDDVTARLVELDPTIAAKARAAADAAGLTRVEVVTGDAAVLGSYQAIAPADVVLAVGIFGNVSEADIRATIDGLRSLSKVGATVLWTRHRKDPDLTPTIRRWFAEAGFDEVGFDHEDGHEFGVGAQRFVGTPTALEPGRKLFEFVPGKR